MKTPNSVKMLRSMMLVMGLGMMSSLSASKTIDMGGTTARLDTLDSYQIGPGVIYSQMRVTKGSKVRTFNLMDVDMTNQNNNVELVVADGGIKHMETLSKMSARLDAPGHRMLGGMNCTPYIMGVHEQEFPDEFGGLAYTPCYGVCSNGWPVASHTNYDRGYECNHNYESGYFAIDINKKAYVNDFYFNGYINTANGDRLIDLNELNRTRSNMTEDRSTVFNQFIGTTPARNCQEILFSCDGWITNGDMTCTVTGKNTTGGTTLTGNNGSVQGINAAATVLSALNVGDTFTLHINMEARDGSTTTQIMHMGGGFSLNMYSDTLTVRNTQEGYSSMDYRRPMIGTNKEGNRMWLMEIESPGMSTAEGCYILKSFGANDAAAFDGGGSAQMYVLGEYKQPSTDAGGERSLPVGLWVVGTAPDSEDAGQMAFLDPLTSIPAYASYTPTIRAWTADGMYITSDYKKHTLSCEPATLGTISADGLTFTANPVNASGLLVATYGNARATTPIEIRDGEVRIVLDSVVLGNRDYEIEVKAIAGSIALPLSPKALTWSLMETEDAPCSVNSDGVLHAIKQGRSQVVGALSQFSDTLQVIVEPMDAPRLNVISSTHYTTTPLPLDTTFSFTNTRNASVTLPLPLRLYGNPDSILVVINTTAPVQSMELAYHTAYGESSKYKMSGTTTANVDYTFNFAVDKLADATDRGIYPIVLESAKCTMKDPTKNKQYAMTIKDVILCYNDWQEVTGLQSMKNNPQAEGQKIMVNGQIYILKNHKIYTLHGSEK